MRWTDILGAFIGRRGSILAAARSPWTLAVGALLVLSASLARKYDTVDLAHEPWELLHGLAAVCVNAMGLHLLFWLPGAASPRPPFWRSYASFLGVFMLSAPLGWLYGVPYEKFMSPVDAVSANLNTLAAVSLVRVVWMTRVLSVLWGGEGGGLAVGEPGRGKRVVGVFFGVMLYADTLAVIALTTMPLPTLDVMGGLQQPPEAKVLASAAFAAGVVAVLSYPVWFFSGLAVVCNIRRAWASTATSEVLSERRGWESWPALLLGAVGVVGWAVPLPWTQAQPRARTAVETRMAAGDVAGAVRELCARRREDFPPVWNPPPRFEERDDVFIRSLRPAEPPLDRLLPAIADALNAEPDAPAWVLEAYGEKMLRWCTRSLGMFDIDVVGRPVLMHKDAEPEYRREYLRGMIGDTWAWIRAEDRPGVIVCMRFLRNRMPSLEEPERALLDRWLEVEPITPYAPNGVPTPADLPRQPGDR